MATTNGLNNAEKDVKVEENAETEETEESSPVVEDAPVPSELETKIIRQVEYYFGDINLPKDKFLQDQIKLDDGWIPLEIMLKFKRLASLSSDPDTIVSALEKSKTGLIEVSEDRKKIRRSPSKPLPEQNEERRKELIAKTIYAKGFPQDSTLDELLVFFQKYGPVESVIMRSYHDKEKNNTIFKGSTFVVFETKEKAEEFLNLEDVKYGETSLLTMWQAIYISKKRVEREENKLKRQQQKGGAATGDGAEEAKSFPKGTVIHLKGEFGQVSREDIRSKFEELGGKVAFISFEIGDEESWIRLQEEGSAKEIMSKLESKKVQIKEAELEVRELEGDEEAEFLKNAMASMMKRRQQGKNNAKNKRGGRQGGRGGKGGFRDRKRKAEDAGDTPPAKEAKV